MRFLRIIAPYLLAAATAIAIFVAGAYASFRFGTDVIFGAKIGQDIVVRLSERTTVLSQLDANAPERAHAFLVLAQDSDLLALDSLAPYLRDDTAKSACRLFRAIAKNRANNPAKYQQPTQDISTDPGISEGVRSALNNPQACAHAGG